MSNISQWPDDQVLAQSADAFDENKIGLDLLFRLIGEALEKLGIGVMGRRICILNAIAARAG